MDQSDAIDRTMASSSSSAVLELQDADGSGGEGEGEGRGAADTLPPAPLIMPHGQDIAVKVDAPMKQLSTLETFVTYRVRCVCARWPTPPHVRRRYNHFKVLHKRLSAAHPLIAAPALPPLHSARQQLDRYSATFVAVRALALNAFLDRVARHPILTHSEDLRLFLTTPDEELDKVFKSENSALNLWGLSSALGGGGGGAGGGGGGGEARTANGARVRDPEFGAAADYLAALQGKLAALCTLTTALYKGSQRLSVDLMSMRRVCDAWAVSAGGRAARAVAACGAGAGAAGRARARGPAPLQHRATLPLLAAYANAHLDKIRARDALHAAYVSNSNATDELHNRLEQASEALRSELSDWVPKTRGEVRALLVALAERQAAAHAASLAGWERALAAATCPTSPAPTPRDPPVFHTVSRTAVQNLSPSRCRADAATPTETERDFDDLDIDHYDDDSDVQDVSKLPSDRDASIDREDVNGGDQLHPASTVNNIVVTELDVHCDDKVDTDSDASRRTEERGGDRAGGGAGGARPDSASKEESLPSDPLHDFSEVDLS